MTLPTNKASEMAELKACPVSWCRKSRPQIRQPGLLYFVRCNECKTQTPHCYTKDEAVDLWNTRTPAPPVTREADEDAAVECVALAIAQEIGWGTFSHFDPGDMRRISRAAIRALKSEPVVDQGGEGE